MSSIGNQQRIECNTLSNAQTLLSKSSLSTIIADNLTAMLIPKPIVKKLQETKIRNQDPKQHQR